MVSLQGSAIVGDTKHPGAGAVPSEPGIRDRPTAARSPWQNGHAERLIGSIRRDCLDYVVVFGERHLRHLLASYQRYYNEARTHLSLNKDAPVSRRLMSAFGT
jgi:transposase InsO family protein